MAASASPYVRGEKVALFLPCYCDLLYPQIGRACVELFGRLGVPLEYPIAQTCCGQPAFNAGYWPEATALAAHFAEVFAEYRWVVVPSGSCAAMARVFYGYMDANSRAASIGAKVFDLATFLVDVLGTPDVGARFPHSVTYHDGCHGRRELHGTAAAMELLRAVRDLRYVELERIEECCGFGGEFSVKFDELSASMGKAKCERILATGAEVLTSSDASCLMHIAGILSHDGMADAARPRIVHLAEILAAA